MAEYRTHGPGAQLLRRNPAMNRNPRRATVPRDIDLLMMPDPWVFTEYLAGGTPAARV